MPAKSTYLVSCVSQKYPYPCPAQELYTSAWFNKARDFVLKSGSPWFILSAEHGLVRPNQVLAPYEKTLNNMGVADRRLWADRVTKQMGLMLPETNEIVILAGTRYREYLEPWLRRRFAKVSVPMQGLPIGKQLKWLSENEPG